MTNTPASSDLASSTDPLLERVLITPELRQRPTRPPDHRTQARALDYLAAALAETPHDALQILTDIVVQLCNAGSAGVSLKEVSEGEGAFRWVAVAGAWADRRGGTLPIDASPCAIVVQRNSALLFGGPHRYFETIRDIDPGVSEVLLVPLHQQGRTIGTLWVAAHDEVRKFDREDVRLLLSLGRMAATIMQTAASLRELEEKDHRLRVMIGELEHRTRNLLSVVRSVATRTARSARDLTEFCSEFDDRLSSLSRAQDLVTRAERKRPVPFDELLRIELDSLGASGKRVQLSGPDGVALPTPAIQMLTMALHELGTNAIKHGALGDPRGRLEVRWWLEPPGDVLAIDWKESGLTFDAEGPRLRKGGGRTLIEVALPFQLDAETSLELEDDGLRCSIRLPLGPA